MEFKKNIIKKLLFIGLVISVFGQSKFVLSADAEHKQIELVGNSQLINIEPQEDLENSLYLPKDCSIDELERLNQEKAIKILKFLCTFRNNLKQRSPFMESEQLTFDLSLTADKKVQKYFTRGLGIVLTTSIIPFVGFLSLDSDVSPVQAICLISAASAVVTAIGQYVAFIATGNIPDEASQKANAKQNKFNELKKAYIRLARVWVNMYFSEKKELAEDIANKMKDSFDNLVITVKDKVGYAHADVLLCPIKEVMHYILNPEDEKLDISSSVHDYIVSKENQRRLEQPD
ncbi:MAG: hypothetical protein P4L22_00605 [Candidatus Babeliales bacterium]|nr:hypothetical protein [Candidatus Babeliales bacterium]